MSRVPVELRCHAFERFGRPLVGARIGVAERPGFAAASDREGRVILDAEVGERLTARLERGRYYQPIQSATVLVPAGGLIGVQQAITLQVPLTLTVRLLRALLIGDRGRHHVVTTVTAAGKTLAESPQGEPGAAVRLTREDDPSGAPVGDPPIYLAAVPWIHKTDFSRAVLAAHGLAAPRAVTSVDGGVLIADVPPGRYRLTASKPGVRFTSAVIVIDAGSPMLINVSPPHGPRVIG